MASFRLLEIPRPKTFLYCMSLRTGAELITLTVLINKISGFYGILALFTGYELNGTQLSMYIYSLIALGLALYLMPHIRLQTPLQCLALAYFYAIDTIINAAYTATFAVSWFLLLAQHPEAGSGGKAPGSGTIDDTAGFTNPQYNVSSVQIIPTPAAGVTMGQDAVTVGHGDADAPAGLGNAVFQSGSIMSVTIISCLWAMRVYFILVMLAYARGVLRQHIATTSSPSAGWQSRPAGSAELAENPFTEGREEGYGWQGRLGRAMLSVAPHYWLGDDEDGEWMRGMGGKFRKSAEPAGVLERERRRRSGTGPPAPAPRLADLSIAAPH